MWCFTAGLSVRLACAMCFLWLMLLCYAVGGQEVEDWANKTSLTDISLGNETWVDRSERCKLCEDSPICWCISPAWECLLSSACLPLYHVKCNVFAHCWYFVISVYKTKFMTFWRQVLSLLSSKMNEYVFFEASYMLAQWYGLANSLHIIGTSSIYQNMKTEAASECNTSSHADTRQCPRNILFPMHVLIYNWCLILVTCLIYLWPCWL
jgi:hypothetical protein